MGALKGIHALATSAIGFFIIYMSWEFINNFYSSITDPILGSILWISLILFIATMTLGVPALIAMSEDSDASILSAVAGLGMYFAGVLFMRIFTPIMEIFIGGNSISNGILQDTADSMLHGSNSTFAVQIMSLIWILGALLTLLIMPIAMAAAPNLYTPLGNASKVTKEVMEN